MLRQVSVCLLISWIPTQTTTANDLNSSPNVPKSGCRAPEKNATDQSFTFLLASLISHVESSYQTDMLTGLITCVTETNGGRGPVSHEAEHRTIESWNIPAALCKAMAQSLDHPDTDRTALNTVVCCLMKVSALLVVRVIEFDH